MPLAFFLQLASRGHRRQWRRVLASALLGMLFLTLPALGDTAADEGVEPDILLKSLVAEGESLRNLGNLHAAQYKFDLALEWVAAHPAFSSPIIAAAEMASGYNLFLLNKREAAEVQLKDAFVRTLSDSAYSHALVSEYIATLSLANGELDEALLYNNEAHKFAKVANALGLEVSVELMHIGLSAVIDSVKFDDLSNLALRLEQLPTDLVKGKLELALAQAMLGLDRAALKAGQLIKLGSLVNQLLNDTVAFANNAGLDRLKVEAQASIVQFYQVQGKTNEALALSDDVILLAEPMNAKELVAQVLAVKGDLLRLQGDFTAAMAAYEQAGQSLTAISVDLPLNLPDGRSTVNVITDPIHRKYADLLLQMAEGKDAETATPLIIKAMDNMEIIKEADLQDFFLGKCKIESTTETSWHSKPLADAAIVYPIVFHDRVALIVKTDQGYSLHSVNILEAELKKQVSLLEHSLQDGKDFRLSAKKLYDVLVRPVKQELEDAGIKTLVYVPDRDIRSIPYAAFYDGKHYAVESFGIATMPSLAFPNFAQTPLHNPDSKQLFAGLSKPDGPSLDKLPRKLLVSLEDSDGGTFRGLQKAKQRDVLTDSLSLPSVEKEIGELANDKTSKVLLNRQFTTATFKENLETGDFDKVHIASHGFFGNNAKDSFILAYDEVLSLEAFEGSLSSTLLKQKPIDLLTLSACQTAQGNDRLLLGFSGMAIKSNVKSALGSLWPIDDEGAMEFMKLFYTGINQPLEKAQALKAAQVAMIKSVKFKHPYYWSPFILTGSWQ